MLLAQATQPVAEAVRWTPEFIAAAIAGLVTLVGAVSAAVVAVIQAAKAGAKAEAASNVANMASGTANSANQSVTRLAHSMPPPGSGQTIRCLLPFLLVPLLGGCASPAFVAGVRPYGNDLAAELKDYANADTTIDVATKANTVAAADALTQAVNAGVVFLAPVEAAWSAVRDTYSAYVSADPDLDPDEKNIRAANVARMDRLIADEGTSPFDVLFGTAAGGVP